MKQRLGHWATRTGWQLILAAFALVLVLATFTAFAKILILVKALAGLGICLCFFFLGRSQVSRALSVEFALVLATVVIGLLTQISDTMDARAVVLGVSYLMTASTAFLIAPSALRRRSVQRIVWPGLLLGVTLGTLLGLYIGLTSVLSGISTSAGRLRFAGAFLTPNAAGATGLIGVILAVAAFEATRRWRYLATIPIFIVVMVLADSRGSNLAAIAFLAALPVLRMARWPPRRAAITLSLAAIGMVFLGTVLVGMIHWPDPGQLGPELNRISSGRLTNWAEALSYLDSPLRWLFGLGMSRNFSFAYQSTDFPVPIRGSNADSFFVDLLGRAGLVGLLLFVIILGSLTVRMWRGLTRGSPREASLHRLGLAVLVATVVLGGTNSLIFTWSWLHAMVAWPLIASAATRPLPPPSPL